MDSERLTTTVRGIMAEFADSTGLSNPANPPRRYLWTDAFAVCNFLALYRDSGNDEDLRRARDLIDQVHRVLGRHRDDDSRTGWISGFGEEEGAKHPTAGGLRIGKPMAERGPYEPWDERLEWDRDGQYFHYLTKWMHALSQASVAAGEPLYNEWAVELARIAHARFSYQPLRGGAKRIYWKMSIALDRPQVPSTGLHDALGAYVTYCELRMRADEQNTAAGLDGEIAEAKEMCKSMSLDTLDPLGIGGLLSDASCAVQMTARRFFDDPALVDEMLLSAALGLSHFANQNPLDSEAQSRFAFRELGLSIGLHALPAMRRLLEGDPESFANADELRRRLDELAAYSSVADRIEEFWLRPEAREAGTWTEHRDINMVMLATSLRPHGFLSL